MSNPKEPTPENKFELREAYRALLMVDDACWGEFCGHCGSVLSGESFDDDCGQMHTATQMAHEWIQRNKGLANG